MVCNMEKNPVTVEIEQALREKFGNDVFEKELE